MDSATHALVGWAIAGPQGAAMALLPDVPAVVVGAVRVLRGRLAWRVWLRGERLAAGRGLGLATLAHSAWLLPVALLGPLGVAYCSHVVLDWLVHERTPLLPPLEVWASSAWRWPRWAVLPSTAVLLLVAFCC